MAMPLSPTPSPIWATSINDIVMELRDQVFEAFPLGALTFSMPDTETLLFNLIRCGLGHFGGRVPEYFVQIFRIGGARIAGGLSEDHFIGTECHFFEHVFVVFILRAAENHDQ